MKPYVSAWEAEDGTLHKTQEEADRHEQKLRLSNAVAAWTKRTPGFDIMPLWMNSQLAHFLYDQGVRFPAPQAQREAA